MDPFFPARDAGRRLRRRVLTSIYGIYARHTRDLAVACSRGCAACCTCSVTVTSLEADAVLDYLAATGRHGCLPKLDDLRHQVRFRPRVTTNEMARRCAYGRDVPSPPDHTDRRPCPLLVNDLCSVYPARPFGCRCLVSARDCRQTGHAQIDAFTLTLNSVFLQYIEHLDAGRPWGNLIDMLHVRRYETSSGAKRPARDPSGEAGLATSQRIAVLMVPPEHRQRIKPILAELARAMDGA